MLQLITNLIAVILLGFIYWRRGRDPRTAENRTAVLLRTAAIVLLGLQAAFYLVLGIGEIASGEISGASHLLPIVIIAALAYLAWARPVEGGIALIVCGLITAARFIAAVLVDTQPGGSALSSTLTISALPQIIAGVLFLTAGLIGRRSPAAYSTLAK